MKPLFENWRNKDVGRVTLGEEEIHNLNGMPEQLFKDKPEFDNRDIFFKNDGTAHVAARMSMLSWHGKDGKLYNDKDVKYVWAGLEGLLYSVEDYGKLIRGIYRGSRARIRPTKFD